MLTVRDVLADLDVRLLAGERRLDTPVRWVHISELPDPTPFLSGGELLLTTGMALDSAAGQRAYVTVLADHGLAGLGLGTGFAHAEVPAALREAAAERDFPLFEVPYELPFIAITEQAFTRLVNEQYALLQRSIAAQERLQRIVLGERGLEAIAGALGKLVGGAVLVFDGRGEPLARAGAGPGRAAERALTGEVRAHARRGDVSAFAPADPALAERALVLPVGGAEGGRLPEAWLATVKAGGGLAEIDRLILHQAVTVVALELLRQRVAHTTERRLAGDLINAVVGGGLEGAELRRRLEPFGLGDRVAALVVAAAGAPAEAAVAKALDAEAVGGLVAGTGDLVCALLPGYDDDELFDVAQRVTDRVGTALGEHGPRGAARPPRARGRRPRRPRREGQGGLPRGPLRARGPPARAPPGRPRRPGCQRPRHARWRRSATSAPSSSCSPCRTPTRCACTASRCWARSRRAKATTATSSSARWRPSSPATASGRLRPGACTAIVTPCATASAGSRSSPAAT